MKLVKCSLGGEQPSMKWLCILMPEHWARMRKACWVASWGAAKAGRVPRPGLEKAMWSAGAGQPYK